MPDRKAIESFLAHLRTSRIAGDADAVADRFTDDAIFTIKGFGAPAVGREAIRAAFQSLNADFEFLEFSPITMVIEGNEVATRHRLKVRYIPTGKVAETETSDFFVMRDGEVASLTQYVDTVLIDQLGRE